MTVSDSGPAHATAVEADLAISARSQYALRAMLALAQAQRDGVGPLSVDTIAARHRMPRRFLEKVVADLRVAGLVVSTRGARGGYVLARPASDVSLGEIIRAAPNLSTRAGLRAAGSSDSEGIAGHLPSVWNALRASVSDVLDGTSLDDALTDQLRASAPDTPVAQPV